MRDFSITSFFVISAAIALAQPSPAMTLPEASLQYNADNTSLSELYLSDFFIQARGIESSGLFPTGHVPARPVPALQEEIPHTSPPVHANPATKSETVTYSTLSGWNLKEFIVIIQPYPEYANMLLLGGSLLCLAAFGRKKQLGK